MLLKIVAVALMGVLMAYVLNTAYHLDFFDVRTYKHHPGICKSVQGVHRGVEDFKVLSTGLTFISSGHGNSICNTAFVKKHDMKGRMYVFDFRKPDSPAIELKMKSSQDFNRDTFAPHGLDVLEDKAKGEHIVYVINHVHDLTDRVEKFKFLPERLELVHMKSFFSESFLSLNSLLLTAEDSFYATNQFYYRNIVLKVIEFLGRFAYGDVLYFDGTNSFVVSSNLQGPNGLAMSSDGKFLYVVLSQGKSIWVFKRLQDKSLQPVQSFILGLLGDSLHLSQDAQTLFLSIHPKQWKLLRHVRTPEITAPSSVLALPLKDGLIVEEEISELFHDPGDLISSSTAGMVYDNKLLVGSLIDSLVLCDLNQPELKP